MRKLAVFAALFALACGPTATGSSPPESPPPREPSADRRAPRLPRHGCADPPKDAPTAAKHDPSSDPFREAHARARASAAWDSGPQKAEPPAEFRRLSLSGDAEDLAQLRLEPDPDRLAAWNLTYDGDGDPPFYYATAEILRHRAPPAGTKSLFRHAVTSFHTGANDLAPDVEDDQITWWFNYLSMRTDAHGRRVVEWGVIPKGCERWEEYDLFVEDGEHLWHLRVSIESTAPEKILADWLARFFDAPFAAPLPPERRSLRHDATRG